MIRSQYIEPEIVGIFRDDALVSVEVRSEDAGVIVDSRSFGRGREIPRLGDNVRLPPKEGSWGRASFVPPGRGDASLTDPSDLIITGHAGRRIITKGGRTGTVTRWGPTGIHAIMDNGHSESLPPFFHPNPPERGWDLLTMTAGCRICRRSVSIYTPELVCGACAEEE